MSDDFEARVRDWLRDRGLTSQEDLRALAGNVAALPPRRPNRGRPLLVAAAIVGAFALGVAFLPRFGAVGGASPDLSVPMPPDPAAFTGDPRLASCGALLAEPLYAFEMARARDYRLHLPAMLLSPELDVDEPAFVVVMAGPHPFGVSGGLGSRATNAPGHHDVCILVEEPGGTATRNIYTDVDVTGLTVR